MQNRGVFAKRQLTTLRDVAQVDVREQAAHKIPAVEGVGLDLARQIGRFNPGHSRNRVIV